MRRPSFTQSAFAWRWRWRRMRRHQKRGSLPYQWQLQSWAQQQREENR